MKFRVNVWEVKTTNGWVTVEAEDEFDARQQVMNMDWDEIEDEAEWGSCGDEREIEVGEDVEFIYEPTVSEVLWK